jgi:hypothetical protein
MFKMSGLSKEDREIISERMEFIKKDRLMTIRMDVNNLKPKPRREYWLPLCANYVTLVITNGVNYDYALSIMKQFRPNVTLNIELENFTDEDIHAEKFIEFIGYYNI